MSDVTLTDAEAAEVDWFMSEHMYRHAVSNSPNSWSCDVGCRTRALGRALSPVLAARLSQEREQARAERDREWRKWAAGIAETAGGWREFDGLAYHEASAAQVLHKVRALLVGDPRPAQEGER